MNFHIYSRKRKKLTRLLKRLSIIIAKPWKYSRKEYEKTTRKIKQLVADLKNQLSSIELKRIVGPAALILGLTLSQTTNAQTFKPPTQNPYGLIPLGDEFTRNFVDIDGDGDLDYFAGSYGMNVFYKENTGTSTNPQFGTLQNNPFGIVPVTYLNFTEFADLDNDGDLDLLMGDSYVGMNYFENTGTANAPQFAAAILNPFNLPAISGFSVPAIADLDGDGDLDLLVGADYGALNYYENIGTANSPSFAAQQQNPFGLTATYYYAFPDITDLDKDGDLDILVGEYDGIMQYFENTGTANNPQFAAPQQNPFGLSSTYYIAFPSFADIDDDGDQDLFVGEYYGDVQYFENNTPPVDNDGDLFFSDVDCDDNNAAIFPGATELCDGVDNNCDGMIDEGFNPTTYYADTDNDGAGDPANTTANCTAVVPAGYVTNGDDCDDTNDQISPTATEICDGIDNNCDGNIDEGFTPITYYADTDGDGVGVSTDTVSTCSAAPNGYTAANGDCDDNDSSVFPGATELCDGVDNNCDGMIDEGFPMFTYYVDSDNDGEGDPNMSITTCISITPPGLVTNGDDCDDQNSDIYSAAAEICDGIDNNCNGMIDEGLAIIDYYEDTDNDGYGSSTSFVSSCETTPPSGYVTDNTDCDDTNDEINPGATEIVNNGIDEDCDGADLLSSNEDLKSALGISIYPNPASNFLNISGNFDQIQVTNIEVFDIQGRRVYADQSNFTGTSKQLDVSTFGPGMYILKVTEKSQKTGIQRFSILK